MEEIKVGEYVRTRTQGIKRIDTINENRPVNRYGYEIGSEWDGKLYSTIKTTDILKHSFNIIDLVQYGDYGIMSYRGMIIKKIIGKDDLVELQLKNYKLLKIATKEQMEDILYKVGE